MVKETLYVKLTLESGEYVAKLSQAQAKNDTFTKSINQIGIAATASFVVLSKGLKDIMSSYEEQELAIARLNQQLENWGNYSDDVSQSLITQAEALQEVTRYADKEIISAQAMLGSFRLNAEQIKELTPLLLDVATMTTKITGSELTLEGAAKMVGLALEGQAGRLRQAGISITDLELDMIGLADRSQRAALMVNVLKMNADGLARSAAAVDISAFKSLQNVFDDLKQVIGKELAPGLIDIADGLKSVVKELKSMPPWVLSIIGSFLKWSTVLTGFVATGWALSKVIAVLSIGIAYLAQVIGLTTGQLWLVAAGVAAAGVAMKAYVAVIDAETAGLEKELDAQKKAEEGMVSFADATNDYKVENEHLSTSLNDLSEEYTHTKQSITKMEDAMDSLKREATEAKTVFKDLEDQYNSLKDSWKDTKELKETNAAIEEQEEKIRQAELGLSRMDAAGKNMNVTEEQLRKTFFGENSLIETQNSLMKNQFDNMLRDIRQREVYEQAIKDSSLRIKELDEAARESEKTVKEGIAAMEDPVETLTIDQFLEKLADVREDYLDAKQTFEDKELKVIVNDANIFMAKQKLNGLLSKYADTKKAIEDNPINLLVKWREVLGLGGGSASRSGGEVNSSNTIYGTSRLVGYESASAQQSVQGINNYYIYGIDKDRYQIASEVKEQASSTG